VRQLRFKKSAWILIPAIILSFFSPPVNANNPCGSYANKTVTGQSGWGGWGTGPFTDDSIFGAVAVFMGLAQVGETVTLETYAVDNYPFYFGGSGNNVSMSEWSSEWCGFYVKLAGQPAPEYPPYLYATTTSTTTTTTQPPYFNPVTNLTVTSNADGSVDLDWDAPTSSNVDIYAYTVSFYDLDEIGGTTSGGWGVWTNQGTTYSLGEWMFSGSNPVTTGFGPVRFGIKAGSQSCFSNEGVGPCVYGPETIVDANVLDPTPSVTTTTTTSTTTTIVVSTTTTSSSTTSTTTSTTTIAPEPETTTTTVEDVVPPPVETLPTENTTVPIPELETVTTISPTTTNIIETIFEPVETPVIDTTPVEIPEDPTPTIEVPQEVQETIDTAVADIFDSPISDAKLGDAVDNLVADAGTPEELTAVVNSLLDQELTDSQFTTVIDSVFSEPLSDENFSAAVEAVFDDTSKLSADQFDAAVEAVFSEPLSDEQFSAAIEAIFDEPISDEKFASVIDSVLDEPLSNEQFEAVVGILESESVSEEQVSNAVDSILELGVTEDQATDLATSAKVLESIDADQATEIFQEIAVENLTPAEEAALVETLTDAPTEIKEAFEEEIDIFGEGLDDYVPTGSGIDVKARRALIAVTTALTTITTAPTPSGGSSAPSGGGAGGPSGDGGSDNGDRKRIRSRRK
jgi:hypothetical protein